MRNRLAPRREETSDDAAFRLSRIYAEGWNAARKMPLLDDSEFGPAGNAVPNPYATEPERARWTEGFVKAIGNLEGDTTIALRRKN